MRRRRTALLSGVAAATVGLAAVVILPHVAQAATGCAVTYTTNDWSGGFTGSLSVQNLGDPLTSWTLRFAFPNGQMVAQGWSATWTQSGADVTATNLSWNGSLGTGASTSIGFNGTWTGSNPEPTSSSLDNLPCHGAAGTSPT